MGQPRRFQPIRSARSAHLASGALPSTTLPEVLEHSTIRLSDIKRSTEGIAGEGILVKLFPFPRKHMQTLWIVSPPNATSGFPSEGEDAQKSRAKTTKHTEADSLDERTAKAKVTNGKAKGRGPLVRGKGNPLMSGERGKADNVEPDDPSDEEEEGSENDYDEEVEGGVDGEEEEEAEAEEGEAEESEAEEGEAEESEAEAEEAEDEDAEDEEAGEEDAEDDTESHNAANNITTVRNAVEDVENEDNAEEQDDDRNDGEHDEAQAKEVDKRRDRQVQGEEDPGKDTHDEEEMEKEAEGDQEADEAGDMVEKPSETRKKDDEDKGEQAERKEDDEEAGEEVGTHVEMREDREAVEQRVTANNCDGARGNYRLADVTDKEGEVRETGSDGEERMAGEDDADLEKRRKRPLETCEVFDSPTPGDRPNKRSRSNESESEDDAATGNLPRRPASPETTPRLRTPSPTFTTASPASTIAIVRQTSVVPGLEDTKSAVWDAAQRDSVIISLPHKQQTKMVRTALSLISEEGIKELRRFVSNARENGKRGSESRVSEFSLIAPHPGPTTQLAGNALVPQPDRLSYFSALYQRVDVLESKETLFAITKRVSLADMAQYRESLVPKGVGGNQARDANLKLFRSIFPNYSTIERPEDKDANPAASQGWFRLRNRLNEGRAWLKVRDLFGGDGAFLALPPPCVPDSHVSKLSDANFGPLLGLLDVAWRGLDDGARRTMNALVRFALAGQSLPDTVLALERPEVEISAAPAGLSSMLAGWSVSDHATQRSSDPAAAHLLEREAEVKMNTSEVVRGREDVVANAESSIAKKNLLVVDDGLLDNIDFDERLSQQI